MSARGRLRIGVVGTGAMGRNHARILSELPGVELVGVYDLRSDAAREAASTFGTRAFPSLETLRDESEAAVLATPTSEHARIGCTLLAAGLNVLVEKPLASTVEEADRLVAAAGNERVLAVGHVEYHNPAVQALLALGERPGFVEVHRLGVFSPRSLDVDVILDLMIHDLQILHALDDSAVTEVRATGINVLSPGKIDIANVRIALASGCVANMTASRVSGERVRKLRVFLPGRGYYSVDYQQQSVKGYRLEERGGERRVERDDLVLEPTEPLRSELAAFAAACRGEEASYVSGTAGRRALATALDLVRAIEQGRTGPPSRHEENGGAA